MQIIHIDPESVADLRLTLDVDVASLDYPKGIAIQIKNTPVGQGWVRRLRNPPSCCRASLPLR